MEKPVPEYYTSQGQDWLTNNVKDFDSHANFQVLEECAKSSSSRNFCVDFGDKDAWCAVDVPFDAWDTLLKAPTPKAFDTRWINIWGPHTQPDIVHALGRKYGFSPRLLGLMASDPMHRRPPTREQPPKSGMSTRDVPRKSGVSARPGEPNGLAVGDEERGNSISLASVNQGQDALVSLNHYDVVDSIWHWSYQTIDWETDLCIGYNALYNVKPSQKRYPDWSPRADLPNGTRVWGWLILCHDKTVISLFEALGHGHGVEDISSSRQNLLNVLRQLSMATTPASRNPISLVPIRYSIGDDENTGLVDAPGLLFYYLFDDWYTTYSLIAKHGHMYGAELYKLRLNLMTKPEIAHVSELHSIGRQLSVLKRLYSSYELIIARILESQISASAEQPSQSGASAGGTTSLLPAIGRTRTKDQFGVVMSSAALNRFERLRDRIRLYILSEIQDSMNLTDSLLAMNFNLINIKEANSVERLTRITILLAKITIMFLPVSILTAYFSMQVPNPGLTIKAYWIAFSVILAVSYIFVLIFGQLSGTTEGEIVYRSIYRVMVDLVLGVFGRSKVKPN